jgi:subtilisin family serine protease
MATPHVAGLAALVLQQNTRLLPRMVKKLLEDACEPVPFAPNQAGYGIVNVYSSLLRATGAAAIATT